jgi:putative ATP-dependent endonuclease of OLD family
LYILLTNCILGLYNERDVDDMYISSLKIRNFRNFNSSVLSFKKGVNTILGENGSGKTNALYALRLLLDDSLPRNIIKLRDIDFCRNLSNWRGHWIIISIDFVELSNHEGCQTLKHDSGHMDGSNTGTITYFYRPCMKVRQALFDANGDKNKSEIIINSIKIEDYEVLFTGRSETDFLLDTNYSSLVGDFEHLIFPDPSDRNLKSYGVNISPLHEEVSFTFVKALRDVVSDLKSYRHSPLIGLLKGLDADISQKDSEDIVKLVEKLNTNISGLDEIKQVSKGIQDTLHNTVGHTFSPIIDIESALPNKLDKLLQKLSLTVGDNFVDGYSGDLSELSLGGANLIYLALKLLEYEKKQYFDKAAQFLLIEEPEAHIHTHIQKTLFENHSLDKTQVFLTTHSTHISSAAEISDMNILGLSDGIVDVYQPSQGLKARECSRIERYLNATRSTLLFAKGVILVEGDAELILVPALIKKVFGISLDEIGVSLISMDSAFFEHISKLFDKERIRKNCSIITDSDNSIVALPLDPSNDTKFQKYCRKSQLSGIDRKNKLDENIKDNEFIEAFYASHTFEVDFILAHNSPEVIQTLESIYTKKSNIDKSKILLKSSELNVFGQEILRLANKEGKGWFAILLSEKINSDTYIPKYIINALAFSSKNQLTDSIIFKMCQYRLNNPMPAYDEPEQGIISDYFEVNFTNKVLCINEFTRAFPDDDLSYLISLLSN